MTKNMEYIDLKNTYGFKNFINISEQEELLYFINSNLSYFCIYSQKNHFSSKIQDVMGYPKELIDNLRKRIIELDNIGKHYPDLILEDSVSVLFKNSYNTYHKDNNYGEWILTRYNVMLSVPKEGGLSLYGDQFNFIEERAVWKCNAGLIHHGVTKVLDEKPRICLSLGFMIQLQELKEKPKFSLSSILTKLPSEYDYMQPLLRWHPYSVK